MSIGLGVALQRLKQVRSIYSVAGKIPGFTADFIRNKYPGHTSLSSAITHARAGNATMTDGYGPELVVNGGFDSDSDWTKGTGWSIADGVAVAEGSTSDGRYLEQDINLVSGKTYSYEINVSGSLTGSNYLSFRFGGTSDDFTITSGSGLIRGNVTASGSGNLRIRSEASSTDITIDNVSVREMPVIKWAPHNVVTYSEEFDNANWTKTGTSVSENTAVAPNGTQTADKLIEGTSSGNKYTSGAGSAFAVTAGMKVTVSCFIKAGERTWCALGISKTSGQPFAGGAFTARSAYFNLSTGAAGTVGSSLSSSSITDVGDGWYLCSITGTAVASGGIAPFITIALGDGNASYTGDGSSGIYLWGAHLYRSDLGGMVDNPDRGDSYVPTAVRPYGPELVTNGTFDTDSDWTLGTGFSIADGALSVNNAINQSAQQQLTSVVSGRTYVIQFTVSNYVSGLVRAQIGGATSFFSGNGTYTGIVTATATPQTLLLTVGGTAATFNIDNVSVKETVNPATARYLPRVGHHVYNGSAWVNEGVLAESELRVNLAPYSDFSSGFNDFRGTLSNNQAVSPDGTQNAAEFTESTNTGDHFSRNNITVTASINYTVSVYVKQGSGSRSAILRTNAEGTDDYVVFDFATESITETGSGASNATSQSVGNGWYRIAFSYTQSADTSSGVTIALSNSATPGSSLPSYTGDGSSSVYFYGLQFEEGNSNTSVYTPSSLIPTSGQQATREAESFTIPSANLPWSQSYGTEVSASSWTGSGWDTFTSTGDDFSANKSTAGGTDHAYSNTAVTVVNGQSVKIDVDFDTGTNTQAVIALSSTTNARSNTVTVDPSAGGTKSVTVTATQSGTFSISVRTTQTGTINVTGARAAVVTNDPVSIAMDGRMTYADEDVGSNAGFFDWRRTTVDYLRFYLSTSGTRLGEPRFEQRESNSGKTTVSGAGSLFKPDVLVPFNISGRFGSTFINGAVDGVSLTESTAPTALADLSATDLDLAYDYMGTISEFRVWDKDLGDDGLVEATNPSLEPSLSLEFSGLGTSSFIVNDWSE